MTYSVEGRLLEVCTCNILCPCWVGEDPDGGTCDSILAYQIDNGTIEGVDVSGHTIAQSVHIPGNILAGGIRAVYYVDDQTTDEQMEKLLKVWRGDLGGPIADVASLVGEVAGVERVPITFTVVDGEGVIQLGDVAEAELAPFIGATGEPTTLNDSVFTTIPGSSAYVGKASRFRRNDTGQGLSALDISGYNAIQGTFRFEA